MPYSDPRSTIRTSTQLPEAYNHIRWRQERETDRQTDRERETLFLLHFAFTKREGSWSWELCKNCRLLSNHRPYLISFDITSRPTSLSLSLSPTTHHHHRSWSVSVRYLRQKINQVLSPLWLIDVRRTLLALNLNATTADKGKDMSGETKVVWLRIAEQRLD